MSERSKQQVPPDSLIGSSTQPPSQRPQGPSAPPGNYATHTLAITANSASPPLQRPPLPPQPHVGNGRTMELPPLPRAPSASGGSFSPASRFAGVSSILNPAEPDGSAQGRRRKASQLESPAASTPVLPPLSVGAQPPQSALGHGRSITPGPMSAVGAFGERPPRRILTPRSPSLHRATSLNQLHTPSAKVSAQQVPFPVSPHNRTYTIEPGSSGAPPLPTPPAMMRQQYGFSAPTPSTQAGRRASVGTSRSMRPASESTSPRSSYSSYSQAGHASPGAHVITSSMPTLSSAYSNASGHGPGVASAPTSVALDRQRAVGVPMSSSGGQPVYQLMTLETTSGTVQLPVDVQAASRVADEKRRRNAGASARFRQRRKEKEKEASTTISRLEQQVKELGEEVNYYRGERDYLVGVVLSTPGGERHFPRPQSPRHRRSGSLTAHGGSSGAGYVPLQEQVMHSPDDGRNVRRRTSTLSLPPPGQAQSSLAAPGQGYPSPYASQYAHPLAPQPPSQQHPPPPSSSHQGASSLPPSLGRGSLPAPSHSVPPQLMQAPPQTGPWNPYAERRAPGPPGRDGR